MWTLERLIKEKPSFPLSADGRNGTSTVQYVKRNKCGTYRARLYVSLGIKSDNIWLDANDIVENLNNKEVFYL